MQVIAYIAATLSLALLSYGFYLRTTLHNGSECDMTWSVVRFILLPPPNPDLTYRLLKFTDGRDERYTHLVDYRRPSTVDDNTYQVVQDENWCTPSNPSRRPGHIVLYVPGHEGSYMQARSVGAHGTTMTQQDSSKKEKQDNLNRLWDGTKNGTAVDEENFVYDVFTVDFNGEGGGLHGSRLFAQAEFVATSVERIAQECKGVYDGKITIVAHSIGGLVARKAIVLLNERGESGNSLVETLITLATPHSSLLFIVEPSVFMFRRDLERQEKLLETSALRTMSISGGVRDELIPPYACFIGSGNGSGGSVTVLSTNIVNFRNDKVVNTTRLGMDHKAIAWCHHVLTFVRKVIHAGAQRRENLLDETLLYSSSLADKNHSHDDSEMLKEVYGELGSFAIRTSMLYNFRILVALYISNTFIHRQCLRRFSNDRVRDDVWYLAIPLLSALATIPFTGEDSIGIGSTLVLSYNAMSLYYVILHGILSCLSWIRKRDRDPGTAKESARSAMRRYCKYQLWILTLLAVISVMALKIFTLFRSDSLLFNAMSCGALSFLVLATMSMSTIIIFGMGCWPYDNRQVSTYRRSVTASMIVFFPISMIGKVVYAASLLTHQGQAKASSYMDFQDRYSKMLCGAGSCVTGQFYKYDLWTYTICVCICIVMNLLISWMMVRDIDAARTDLKKDS